MVLNFPCGTLLVLRAICCYIFLLLSLHVHIPASSFCIQSGLMLIVSRNHSLFTKKLHMSPLIFSQDLMTIKVNKSTLILFHPFEITNDFLQGLFWEFSIFEATYLTGRPNLIGFTVLFGKRNQGALYGSPPMSNVFECLHILSLTSVLHSSQDGL